jgi:co-chaperonin GroES (HSP10)
MFQPLRNLVLIAVEDIVTEEQRPSGLVVLRSNFNLYQWGQDEVLASDILYKKKQNRGKILASGKKCSFFKEGDAVIYKKNTEQKKFVYDGMDCVMVTEDDVLCKEVEGKLICHPNHVIVKISKEARESLFTKKIIRDDGTVTDLFMYNPTTSDDTDHNARFVSTGEVVFVGENIHHAQVGDVAILDYLVDNDETIIVGYDGEDKLVTVVAVTSYVGQDEWVRANRSTEENPTKQSFGQRLCPKDMLVSVQGDYETLTSVYGVVRDNEVISFDPYVFLVHESNTVQRVSAGGILYSETLKIFERKILAISKESEEKVGAKTGDTVVVDDFDIFDVVIEGRKIHCMNDIDIITVKNTE